MMSLNDFDYNLPQELIAQKPARPRDHAKLLCLPLNGSPMINSRFDKLGDFLHEGDLLVLNNSKVFPARLLGEKKDSGGKVEVFLHRSLGGSRFECLVGGRVKPGLLIVFSSKFNAELVIDQGDGTWLVDFNLSGDDFWNAVKRLGKMPLPPYIAPAAKQSLDRSRYQTVYADDSKLGSVAAPTAGLHFTDRLLKSLQNKGIFIAHVTLHVGLGTFAGVKSKDIRKHQMHAEYYVVDEKAAKAISMAKREGRRIVAVGTTSCRVLESYGRAVDEGKISLGAAYQEWTDIFIYPGYKFKLSNALITNFHLPKSSLLMLVSALAGRKRIKEAYSLAIAERYRFYSFGDAMFIG